MSSESRSKESRVDHFRKGQEVPPLISVVAGSISGAIARAITAPIDTIKIRLQLSGVQHERSLGPSKTFINICKNEGVKALWKGNVPAEILYVVYGATQFTAYSLLSKTLSDWERSRNKKFEMSSPVHSLVVGTGAGISSTIVTYPFDLLRTRLVANLTSAFLSMTSTAKQIYQSEGLFGFYAGVRPAVVSVAATTGLMFWTYEMAREFTEQYHNVPFIEGMCGLVAGTSAKAMTFPLDTLRKRIQMYAKTKDIQETSHKAWTLCKIMMRKEGIRGFYKGFGVSVLKSAPTSAISLFMYEYTLDGILRFDNKGSRMN